MTRPTFYFRCIILVLACALTMAPSCSGSQCNTGTQQQLANPTSGQAGVQTTIGQIIIVGNGNNNALYTGYNQWEITLTDASGLTITGGPLQLVPDPGGFHPYSSDFFYASPVPTLPVGQTWNATLKRLDGSCSVSVGTFYT